MIYDLIIRQKNKYEYLWKKKIHLLRSVYSFSLIKVQTDLKLWNKENMVKWTPFLSTQKLEHSSRSPLATSKFHNFWNLLRVQKHPWNTLPLNRTKIQIYNLWAHFIPTWNQPNPSGTSPAHQHFTPCLDRWIPTLVVRQVLMMSQIAF
jgi:hypothetical protein